MRVVVIFSFVLWFIGVSGQDSNDGKCYILHPFVFSADSTVLIQPEVKWAYNFDGDSPARGTGKLVLSYDINNDGIAEIITQGTGTTNSYLPNKIKVLDSRNGQVIRTITLPFEYLIFTGTAVIGDVYNDGNPVIIVSKDISSSQSGVQLVCLDFDGNIKWESDVVPIKTNKYIQRGYNLGLADFNRDGIPELYLTNIILNARTGKKLIDGGSNGLGLSKYSGTPYLSISVAANVDDDDDLELVAGYSVYKVTITNTNDEAGNAMMPINIMVNGVYLDGCTSISDIDLDGKLDIIVSVNSTEDDPNPVDLYCYTISNGIAKLLAKADRKTYPSHGIDTDQYVKTMAGTYYNRHKNREDIFLVVREGNTSNGAAYIVNYSYDGTLNLKKNWIYPIIFTGDLDTKAFSIFDLDNDGYPELFVRLGYKFIIISTKNDIPKLLYDFPCHGIGFDSSIIGDFDNTGQAKICMSYVFFPPNNSNSSPSPNKLAVFGARAGQRWAPARNIWHQYAYNPLFINDDGTVPQHMHNPATYKNGKYNNFMAQASTIDENGNYPLAVASLTGDITCTSYDAATGQYSVDFGIYNRQHASATAKDGVAVSFYSGNPESGGTLIGVYHTAKDIRPDSTLNDRFSFTGSDLNTLWMIVNTDRYPIIVSDTSYYGIDECDYTDNVYIVPLPQVTKENKEICGGDSYDFYGAALTQAGQYIHETKNISGCDSIITVLTLAVTDIKTAEEVQTSCERYVWNGQTYTSSGSYTYQTTSVNGCDSITTLHLTIHQPDQINESKAHCGSYVWNGQTYTTSGIYNYQTQNIHGCDSTVTLDLKLYPQYQDTIIKGACDSYLWNGMSYTNSGTYTYTGQTTHGCDSIVTLQLTISDILYSDQSITYCDSYTWHGQTYDTSGDYSITGKSIYGCDSITTLHLTIHPSSTTDMNYTSCDTYSWNNQTYTQSGDYSFKTQNIYGCDSTATLRLTIHPSTYSSASVNTCSSYDWNGQHYTQSGSYTHHTQNIYGCDSIATLHLTINQPDDVNTSHTACDNYTWNNMTYTQSGHYTYSTQNIYGCDSTTTLQLTIHPSATQSIALTECDSLSYLGQTFRTSGIYKFNLQTQYGCDSIVSLNLTISGDKLNDTQSACGNYTWPVNNKTYDQSGIYIEKYQNISGCDSTIALNLTIYPIYTEQKAAEACAHYEWEATKQRFTQSGIYTTTLRTTHGCDSTITLSLIVHPEYEYHDTIVTDAPYWWPVSNETYDQSGIYSKAYVSEYACDSIRYLHLTIRYQTDIYFPNVLTPDSRNGYFTGYSTGHATTIESLSVYDRWGNLMYQKEHFPTNEPESGWNGTYKGQPVTPGVYVWIAIIRLKDGSEVTYTGDVTVVR